MRRRHKVHAFRVWRFGGNRPLREKDPPSEKESLRMLLMELTDYICVIGGWCIGQLSVIVAIFLKEKWDERRARKNGWQ